MYFSVIVTVYRVEAYLKACVESILGQTFQDFELLLVDDGSPDGCPGLCDAYAAVDHRVQVIHQTNAGPADARKSGLKAAKGQYITFVDGDDWISPRFLERGHALIGESKADMLAFASSLAYGIHTQIRYEPVEEGLYEREALRKKIYPVLLMDARMRHMLYSISGKIFSRALAQKSYLAVNGRITLGEDMLGMLFSYLEAERVYISREILNFYRIREQSGSHGFRPEHFSQVCLVLEELEKLKRSGCELPGDFGRQKERYGAWMCFTIMIHAVNDGRLHDLRMIKEQMRKPLLKECICSAEFKEITPKTRVTYFLLRQESILSAYLFLRLCRRIKRGIRKGK